MCLVGLLGIQLPNMTHPRMIMFQFQPGAARTWQQSSWRWCLCEFCTCWPSRCGCLEWLFVGTNTDSLIQPSVPCEEEFSTGTWDVSSTAFNFQQISHIYDGKSNVHTSLKKVTTLEVFRDEALNHFKCKGNSWSSSSWHPKPIPSLKI